MDGTGAIGYIPGKGKELSDKVSEANTQYVTAMQQQCQDYVNYINLTWCSANSLEFMKQLKTSVDSAVDVMKICLQKLNATLEANVARLSGGEGQADRFEPIDIQEVDTTPLSTAKDVFEEGPLAGGFGIITSKRAELDANFDTIIKSFKDVIENFKNHIHEVKMFGEEEEQQLMSCFDSLAEEIETQLEKLKSTYEERISGEVDARTTIKSENVDTIGQNISAN